MSTELVRFYPAAAKAAGRYLIAASTVVMVSAFWFPATVKAGITPRGDPDAGEAVYQRCTGCHSLDRNRTGPRHCGVIGRPAGTVPGFNYSEAMRQSGLVWTVETLDVFLAAPLDAIPGTTMGFAGIPDIAERHDLIAYLAAVNRPGGECVEP